jgi:hypothetical protein
LANEDVFGTPWTDDELDAIVADYFAMREAELVGRPYVKARHNEALREKVQRSRGSVEYKHQNISAVLAELGMDWLPGYKPAINYQNALFDAIDRYLSADRTLMEQPPPVYRPVAPSASVFVPPPPLSLDAKKPPRLKQLIRKFDPVERDRLNRALGRAGEEFVLEVERSRLTKAGLSNLARNVRWISEQEGDGAGYDILSFDQTGRERLVEVKTTNGAATTPFFLSRNEHDTAAARVQDWRLYRVHCFSKEPRIFEIAPPLEKSLILQTESWRASFSA